MTHPATVGTDDLPLVLREDPAELASRAPGVFDVLVEAWSGVADALGGRLQGFLLARVNAILVDGAVPADPRDAEQEALAPLVDQFVDYVPDVSESEIGPVRSAFGDGRLREVLEAIWVTDQLVRLGLVQSALFDAPPPGPPLASISPRSLRKLTALWHDEVCALRWLDSPTSEVNRIRGAFYHDCRMCQSVRLVEDGQTVIPAEVVVSVRDGQLDSLPQRYRLALQLADAHMVDPTLIDTGLVASLRAEFSADELRELTLDMTAWNFQKVSVSVRSEPPYREGQITEMFIQADGRIKFGGSLGPPL